MDPQVKQYLDQTAALNRPGWEHFPPPEARRLFAGLKHLFGDPVELHRVADHKLDNGVTLRAYHPSDTSKRPALTSQLPVSAAKPCAVPPLKSTPRSVRRGP